MSEPLAELPSQKGMYLLTLYGRAGSKLYECYVPWGAELKHDIPAYHEGIQVYSVTLEWVET